MPARAGWARWVRVSPPRARARTGRERTSRVIPRPSTTPANPSKKIMCAWNLNPQGQPNPQPAIVAEQRQLLISLSPHGFIKAAQQAGNATVEDRYYSRTNRTLKVVGFTTMGKYRVTGEFNNDNLLERVITWIPDSVLGDMMVEIRYSDYRDVGGGAKFPFRSHAHQGDNPLVPGGHNRMEVRVTDAKVNVPDAAGAL